MKNLKYALLYSKGIFNVYSNAEDCVRSLGWVHDTGDTGAKSIAVLEVPVFYEISARNVLGRVGDNWYLYFNAETAHLVSHEDQPEPCPFCGRRGILVGDGPYGRMVQCTGVECAVRGPVKRNDRAALEGWNHRIS